MKLLLLADHSATHTLKWVRALTDQGVSVLLFSLSVGNSNSYKDKNVEVVQLNFSSGTLNAKHDRSKWRYLKCFPLLKGTISRFKPDIVHAHYATSYGLLGALSGFHPFIISVWGSDVYDFPTKSFWHRSILKFNLRAADKVLSTSSAMATETKRYTDHKIEVTPFGIDLKRYKALSGQHRVEPGEIVVGTIKALEEVYGISYLIRAFAIVVHKYPELPLKLLIVGGGAQLNKLQELAKELSVEQQTLFTGKVHFDKVPDYHNKLDIYVALSISESFGVAVIEASACERPVVVSDVGGLPEVVEHGVTGLVVKSKDEYAAAEAIEQLVLDKILRKKMGKAGRERVEKLYNWEDNVNQMMDIYKHVLA